MEQSLVDRVSKVICRARCSAERPDPGNGLDEYIARAAIAKVLDAMQTVSDGMVMAGIAERHEQPVPEAWSLATANVWTAMLSQFRKEAGV